MSTRDYESGAIKKADWRGGAGEVKPEAESSDTGTIVSGVRDNGAVQAADSALADYLKRSRRIYERIERAMRFVRDEPAIADEWQDRTLDRLRQLEVQRLKRTSHE